MSWHPRWAGGPSRLGPRAPGDLVAWGEVHPDARHDHYLDRADKDQYVIANDLYCVNPTCTCSEAVIDFAPVKYTHKNGGTIRVHLPDLEAVERTVTPNQAGLQNRLWSAFLLRHPRKYKRCCGV